MRKIFNDEGRQNDFIKKGYVKVPLLSPEEVSYILSEIKNLNPDDNFEPDEKAVYGQTFHTTFLDTSSKYKRNAFDLISKTVSKHISQTLSNYRILSCQFFIKPPGKGDLGPHQNFNFIPDINETSIGIFCPLVDVDEVNGAIQVVEGSHKIFPNVATPSVPSYSVNFENSVREKYSKMIPLKAGESLFFDDSLLHWSEPNKSDSPRYAMVIICVPVEYPSVIFYFDHNAPEKGFEMFEINSDFFVENTILEMLERPKNLKSLGFIENKNRVLNEDEFVNLLATGDETRRKIYFPTESKSFFGSLKNNRFLRRLIGN